ncbi:TetR-like C-terminal domain-containing protein [Herbiconiux sp. KACC 21604]|uniref:TetR/AcrR family transcriptional regulator n=1 Tax=unclassified Herbiconiux TaxID=2618217 RepID=UPI0014931841|nr:TetR-like C-terminal domain-containing protein [Herbiconiux sp. SALV-R1]QJU53081.1 TetR/AcrR family transcriptional regulator [Herbiconiux sp. SALV-R1]WPO88013.1 TetR-like C-terminal domain-containing protein [Herbiconiux sp. KACC 21604]
MTTALFELLREHDLTEISISELCRTAGVHRTTFYGHYGDIFAFAADSFASILDEMSNGGDEPELAAERSPSEDAAEENNPAPDLTDLDHAQLTTRGTDAVRQAFEHVAENRAAYRMMFNTRVDAGFRRELFVRMFHLASLTIAAWRSQGGTSPAIDTPTAAAFIAGGMVGVLEDWANSDDTDIEARTSSVLLLSTAWCAVPDLSDAVK